ncbi:MAG: DUF1206 domain-containing protein [Verrucomicrobiales bacterium]|nr:DUF1206 domain-containing protein [Verrucomicrobiales bacterium]
MKNLEPSYKTSNFDTKISSKLNSNSGGLFTVGYAAKGVLYAILGILCISSAFGPGGSELSLQESLRWLKEKPFGTILLAVVGLGVVAYALYRVGCAVFDLEDVGNDGKGIGKRLGFTASALTYFAR